MQSLSIRNYLKSSQIVRRFYNLVLLLRNWFLYYCRNRIIVEKGNRIIKHPDLLLKNSKIRIVGNNNTLLIGDNCKLSGLHILISGNDNYISIGNGMTINASKSQPTVINAIGERKKISFGENCLLSNNIEIHTSDYHGIYNLSDGSRANPDADILIGNNVWIGLGVTILKGSEIGNDCVVGAKSLVVGKFNEDNVMIVGNPAHIVGNKKICWTKERAKYCNNKK